MDTQLLKNKEEKKTPVFVSLASDTTFKYLYKNKKTRTWFQEIIYDQTGIDLSDYELIDNELNTGNKVKDYRLDVLLKKDRDYCIIEMNTSNEEISFRKAYSYLYRIAGNRYFSGEKYSNKPTTLIIFNSFPCREDKERNTLLFLLKEDKNHKITRNMIQSYEIYIPKVNKKIYNKIEKRLQLFGCTSYEEMREITDDPDDLVIIEELEKLGMNEEFLFGYSHELAHKTMMEELKEESFEDGVKLGIEQEKREIAKAMLKKNMDIETISEITNVSLKELNNLKQKEESK